MKRVFLSLLIGVLLSFNLITPVHAEDEALSWIDAGYAESIKSALLGEINAAAHISNVNTNTYSDFVRRVLGPVEGVTISSEDMNTPYADKMRQQSAVSELNNYIASIYMHPPASTYAFVNDVGQTLGFIPKQAYAQGIGFTTLSPLLPIWKVFRNIAYALLAIIMMVVGFLVMFRKKIDPKTVVTVQNALPKIVVSLILITFSYAIVGLMIDLMYIVIYLLVSLLTNAVPSAFSGQDVMNDYTNANFGKLGLFNGIGGASDNIAKLISSNKIGQSVSSALIGFLVGLAIIFVYLRILTMLIMAYIQIIISLIISPVQLLLDAIPGSTGGFAAWMKNLISQLIVFPVTALLLVVGTILTKLGETSSSLWAPPFLGSGTDSGGLMGAITIGIMITIPTIVKGLQESLKAKPMVNMAGGAGLSGTMGTASQILSLAYYVKGMSPEKVVKPQEAPPPKK